MEETGATGRNHPLIELRPVKRIARVQALMLKQSKKIDETKEYMEHLRKLKATEAATTNTYAELSKAAAGFEKGEEWSKMKM